MNDLSFTQISTLLNSISKQATGQNPIAITDAGTFVSVAQTTLLTGYDNVINAISQVLSRTIFSIRPYNRKLAGLQVSEIRYGNHVRKLQSIDKPFQNDQRQPLTDGKSVDMQVVNKPEVVQTNFYGESVYEKSITIFKDQLDAAFSSPEEFGRFISMVMTNVSDQIEQAHESLSRGTIANLIGGTLAGNNSNQVVRLLSEYNAATGNSYTPTTVLAPDVYKAFTQWAFARIAQVSSMLTERTTLYHTNLTDKVIPRHTPYARQKVYTYAPYQYQIESMVLANTFHDNYLRQADTETLNFWQSVTAKDTIKVKATYMKPDGTLTTKDVTQAGVYGVTFDEEACGYTVVNQWSAPAPFNAAGGYTNIFWHFTDRYWNDFTENCVVFLLE